MADHLAACQQQLESRRAGRVTYPRSLAVPLDQSATYEVSLDIRPGAQQRPAPDTDTNVEDVEIPCGVGARLIALGDSITIEDEGEWNYRQFDTPGVFEWGWDVRASKAEDTRVRLDLRPAIAVRDGGYVVPGNDDPRAPTASYESNIDVEASIVDEASFWAENTWPKISGIAIVIGAALIGVTAWFRKFVGSVRGREEASAIAEPTRAAVQAASSQAVSEGRPKSAAPPQGRRAAKARRKRSAEPKPLSPGPPVTPPKTNTADGSTAGAPHPD